jgi:hypothetical protein
MPITDPRTRVFADWILALLSSAGRPTAAVDASRQMAVLEDE